MSSYVMASLSLTSPFTESVSVPLELVGNGGQIHALIDTPVIGSAYLEQSVQQSLGLPSRESGHALALNSYDGAHVEVSTHETGPLPVRYKMGSFMSILKLSTSCHRTLFSVFSGCALIAWWPTSPRGASRSRSHRPETRFSCVKGDHDYRK